MEQLLSSLLPLILSSLGSLCALGDTTATTESETIFSTGVSQGVLEFIVPKERFLNPTNGWNLGLVDFPADIRSYLDRAKEHLIRARGLEGPISLAAVHLGLARRRYVQDGISSRWLERWYLAFFFKSSVDGAPPFESPVVMLLDGTIARERLVRR
jgi:hypothetical protein